MKRSSLFFAAAVCFAIGTDAQVIHVPGDHPSIQAGINSASTGDTVMVAEGTYFENINFKGKAITVSSRFILDGDTAHISKTIIDGSQPSNPDTASVVIMWSGEDTTSVLMGFTITGGTGTKFYSPERDRICSVGGGITVSNSGGKIIHNIIERNYMIDWDGGGIRISYGGGLFIRVNSNHTAIIRKNVIRNNFLAAFADCRGAGAYLNGGRLLFEYNSVLNDTLIIISEEGSGAGVYWTNYAVEGTIEEAIIRNNIIKNNFAADPINDPAKGGGISLEGSFTQARVQVYNNIIEGNHADCGGGLFIRDNRSAIFNNTIYNNNTNWEGIYGNSIYFLVGWVSNDIDANDIVMYNNIIWSEVDEGHRDIRIYDWGEREYTFRAYNNILKEPFSEEDKVTARFNWYRAPVFKTDSTFELAENSPGIGQGVDSLLVDGTWYHAPAFDLYGNPRPHPIDSRVDIGAIESSYEGFVYIPDTLFLFALIDKGVDTNGDSLISYAEAEAVHSLNVNGGLILNNWAQRIAGSTGQILSLEGIESFTNLEALYCQGNQITDLDLTENLSLKVLDCSVNELTSLGFPEGSIMDSLACGMNPLVDLDVSQCSLLKHLDLRPTVFVWEDPYNLPFWGEGTQLTALDITKNVALETLMLIDSKIIDLDLSNNTVLREFRCSGNQLTSLDISKNTDLQALVCARNQLTGLDVSKNTALERFDCSDNQLDILDVSHNTELELFWCWNNRLTSLAVSNLTMLKDFICHSNLLAELDLSQNTALTWINISDMPTLKQVCVWVTPFPPNGVGIDKTGSPNVYFTTECTIGVEEQENDMISIYPNPAGETLTVETERLAHYFIEITSLNCQLMYSTEMYGSTRQIDLSSFEKGVYLITIRSEDFVTTRKIIKLY
jgi:hypothetical protein